MEIDIYSIGKIQIHNDIDQPFLCIQSFFDVCGLSEKDAIIVLDNYDELNECAARCLREVAKANGYEMINLVVSNEDMVGRIIDCINSETRIIVSNDQVIRLLLKVYSMINFPKQLTEYFVPNFKCISYDYITDVHMKNVLEYSNATVEDIVCIGMLGLDYVPIEVIEKRKYKNSLRNKQWAVNWFNPYYSSNAMLYPFVSVEDSVNYQVFFIRTNPAIKRVNRLFFFGMTRYTRMVIKAMPEYRIMGVIDNDPQMRGESIEGIKVYSPEDVKREYGENVTIILTSRHYKEMCDQLIELGYKMGTQIVAERIRVYNRLEQSVIKLSREIKNHYLMGKSIFEEIREFYVDEYIIVLPYPGTGDAYWVGANLQRFFEKQRIKKHIVIVTSKSSQRIMEAFGYSAAIYDRTRVDNLIQFIRWNGQRESRSFIMNDCNNQSILERLRGYKNIDFYTMLINCVMGLSYALPERSIEKDAKMFIQQHGIKKGNTILLSPYSNSLHCVRMEVWENLANILLNMGFNVLTNVSNDNEKAIRGTQGIFIPYEFLVEFVNYAGIFIGIRSGVCDILYRSAALKIILYPSNPETVGHIRDYAYNYFSLERMRVCNKNLMEFCYESSGDEVLEKRIIDTVHDYSTKSKVSLEK